MTDNERKESISVLRQLLAMCDFVDQYGDSIDADPYFDAVETVIESLNETRWIPVSERLPEEHEWIGTKKFGTTISEKVFVTFESPKGERFTKYLSFQNGKLSPSDQQTINVLYKGSVPIAWMPLPEPYKGGDSDE